MKKFIAIILVLSTVFMSLSVSAGAAYRMRAGKAGYSTNWEYWSQGGSKHSKMRKVGCRSVAYAKLIAEAAPKTGIGLSDPDIIYWYNINNGYVTSSYAEYNKHTGKIPEYFTDGAIRFEGKVKLDNSSKANGDAQIMSYINNGYYVILAGPSHTTYVLHEASKQNGTALISDSWSNWAYSEYANKIRYTKYNYASFTNIWLYKVSDNNEPIVDSGTTYTAYVVNTDGSLAINSVAEIDNMIAAVPECAAVEVVTEKSIGNWLYVRYNNSEGYCYGKYLTTQPPVSCSKTVKGTDGNLAINSIPRSGYCIGVIPEGGVCTVFSNRRSGNWVWAKYGDIYGYVYSEYVV